MGAMGICAPPVRRQRVGAAAEESAEFQEWLAALPARAESYALAKLEQSFDANRKATAKLAAPKGHNKRKAREHGTAFPAEAIASQTPATPMASLRSRSSDQKAERMSTT